MYFRMASITQDMRYRLSLIKDADLFGVTKAAIKYKTNRQYIYRWKRRFDGSWDSLRDRSRRPHHHPNQHTPDEATLLSRMRRRNPHAGLVIFWVKLRQKDIPALSPVFTVSSKSRACWPFIRPIPNISPILMKRWRIPDSVSMWMLNLFLPPA